MNQKHIVTTALKEVKDKNNFDTLFLGGWCLNSQTDLDSIKRFSVLPYHWNDRAKLHKDYLFLQEVYEEFLQLLSANLNKIHGVNFSLRYWRIVIGPWLNIFIPVLFDRFSMLEIAFSDDTITNFTKLEISNDYEFPVDMDSFIEKIGDDLWNQLIYQDLIDRFYQDKHKLKNDIVKYDYICNNSHKFTLKEYLKKALTRLSSIFSQEDEPFLLSTNLGWARLFLLQFHLKIFPRFWFKQKINPDQYVQIERSDILKNSRDHTKFYTVLNYMIQKHMPRSYLETYQGLRSQVKKLGWPDKPKSIFTCDAYAFDELFKLWTAEKVEEGSKLLIGQHGGNYGIDLFNADEEHVISISDSFLTWGWNKEINELKLEEDNKVYPFGIFTNLTKKVGYKPDGNLLFVSTNMPRYSYRMLSIPVSSQWSSYFEYQLSFIESLPNEIKDKTLLRKFKEDYGRDEQRRWLEGFPQLKIDNGRKAIGNLYSQSRLVVHSYNATSFLETLYLNIPSVMFWDLELWEIRSESLIYFEELFNVGIFHKTPQSASTHVDEIWGDIERWWHSAEVQKARKTFCEKYAKEVSPFELGLAKKLRNS